MQAIILSGGLGTRLRPLTFTRPKPLMPLYNTTILGHILNGLPKGVDRVCLASNYMIAKIREYIERSEFGPEVIVVEETTPLGTGGAMKNCQRYIDDTFLAFNGDLISSLDLGAFVKFHKKKGGIGSISLWEVENPTAFGIIEVDKDKRILRFKEKPKPEEVFSNKINAGCYVLEPEVFDHIPTGRQVSIEREVFPYVLEKRMNGYPFEGFWIDCGTPELYLKAQGILLANKKKKKLLAKGVKLPKDATATNGCVVYQGASIGARVKISGSVIFPNASIGADSIIERSIIGECAKVGEGCILPPGCILGDGQELLPKTILEPGTKIPNTE